MTSLFSLNEADLCSNLSDQYYTENFRGVVRDRKGCFGRLHLTGVVRHQKRVLKNEYSFIILLTLLRCRTTPLSGVVRHQKGVLSNYTFTGVVWHQKECWKIILLPQDISLLQTYVINNLWVIKNLWLINSK